ncbi:MAG: hypothetical protein MCS20_02160, partial [Candidatus Phytoplasma mali]|nr:hypothetical protein [Candidatus Phytoplasma australiense]MCG7202193.1 hypothetical protein [Candidatus Phytoplasma mali]
LRTKIVIKHTLIIESNNMFREVDMDEKNWDIFFYIYIYIYIYMKILVKSQYKYQYKVEVDFVQNIGNIK